MATHICSRCKNRKAVYYHRLSGNTLCRHCFVRFVNRYLFREFGSRIKMLRRERINNAKFVFIASCNYPITSLACLKILENLDRFLSKMPWLNYKLEIVVDKCFAKLLHSLNVSVVRDVIDVDDIDRFVEDYVMEIQATKQEHNQFLVLPYSLDVLSYMVVNAFTTGDTRRLRVLCVVNASSNMVKPFANLVLEDVAYYVYLNYGLDLLQMVSQYFARVHKDESRYPIAFNELKPIFSLSGEYLFAPLKILDNFCRVIETFR